MNLRNSCIKPTNEATFLGTTFAKWMTREGHINRTRGKIKHRVETLRNLTNWGVPREGLRTFYLSMIRPVLEFGYHLTHDHKPSTDALEVLQSKCIRVITWSSNRTSAKALQENLGVSMKEHPQACRQKALRRYQGSALQDHLDSILESV